MTKKQKRGDEGVIRNRSDGEGGGIVGGAPWLPENQKTFLEQPHPQTLKLFSLGLRLMMTLKDS